uniref:Reverse transcriptase zinc-binding domain-containing protein n=1 Tax=Brassica oleracea TaxID=3712 RepID=A0A3P6EGH8_BRAOL|nr:unnamed protein product [Brassica oleracea]
MWKSLLKLRPLAERFIKCEVGNGLKASFWNDCWTPLGSLIKCLGDDGPRRLRIPLHSSVAEACSEDSWNLPHPRSENEVILHAHLTTVAPPVPTSSADKFFWTVDGIKLSKFSAPKTWQQCRPREPPKEWSKLIWFSGCVPKHAFNMWIAQLDRMPVRTRLERWGVTDASNCPVCLFGIETRDHILLTCGYSSEIWRYVLPRLESPNVCFMNWTELLSWIKAPARGNFCTLKKIVTQSTLYHIWRQRNNILHNQVLIPPDTVFRIIDREVRNIPLGRRGRRPYNTLLSSWLKFE